MSLVSTTQLPSLSPLGEIQIVFPTRKIQVGIFHLKVVFSSRRVFFVWKIFSATSERFFGYRVSSERKLSPPSKPTTICFGVQTKKEILFEQQLHCPCGWGAGSSSWAPGFVSRLTVVGSTPAVGESPLNVKLERVLFRFIQYLIFLFWRSMSRN